MRHDREERERREREEMQRRQREERGNPGQNPDVPGTERGGFTERERRDDERRRENR